MKQRQQQYGRCTQRLLLAIALLWGLICLQIASSHAVQVQSIAVEVSPNQVLTGQLYTPRSKTKVKAAVPSVLFCHGLSSHKDTFAPLAWELAARGIAGVVFDFGGYGQSYDRPISPAANFIDAEAMLNWMKQAP